MTQTDTKQDHAVEKILFEYRMDIERFSYGAGVLLDKATRQAEESINQVIARAVAEILDRLAEDAYEEKEPYGINAFRLKVVPMASINNERRRLAKAVGSSNE